MPVTTISPSSVAATPTAGSATAFSIVCCCAASWFGVGSAAGAGDWTVAAEVGLAFGDCGFGASCAKAAPPVTSRMLPTATEVERSAMSARLENLESMWDTVNPPPAWRHAPARYHRGRSTDCVAGL